MKNLVLIVLFSFLSLTVFAQGRGDKGNHGNHERGGGKGMGMGQAKKIGKELGLSAEQTEKLKVVFQEQKPKMQALRKLPKSEKKEAIMNLKTETNAKIKEILTAEQFTKFEAMKKDRAEGRAERMTDRIGTELSLSEDQKKQLNMAFEERMTDMDEIKEESKGDKKAVREEFQKKLKEILTPEQQEKFKTLMQEKKGKFKEEDLDR